MISIFLLACCIDGPAWQNPRAIDGQYMESEYAVVVIEDDGPHSTLANTPENYVLRVPVNQPGSGCTEWDGVAVFVPDDGSSSVCTSGEKTVTYP